MTAIASDPARPPKQIAAMTVAALGQVLLRRQSVERRTLSVEPVLSEGVTGTDMTIVTVVRPFAGLAEDLVAAVTDRAVVQQAGMRDRPVHNRRSGRDPGTIGAEMTLETPRRPPLTAQFEAMTRAAIIEMSLRLDPVAENPVQRMGLSGWWRFGIALGTTGYQQQTEQPTDDDRLRGHSDLRQQMRIRGTDGNKQSFN